VPGADVTLLPFPRNCPRGSIPKSRCENLSKFYVSGFFDGLSDDQIPLEKCAYQLDDRFISAAEPFSVDAEVRRILTL
jgi:hypothetical protein